MIIDAHAHALDEAFLDALSRKPAFGLSVERRPDGRFWVKREKRPAHSLDEEIDRWAPVAREAGVKLDR